MKRYDLRDFGSRGPGLEEATDGEVVLYSDVAPLVEALRKISEAGHRYASTAHIGLIADDALTTIDAQEMGV